MSRETRKTLLLEHVEKQIMHHHMKDSIRTSRRRLREAKKEIMVYKKISKVSEFRSPLHPWRGVGGEGDLKNSFTAEKRG